MPAKHDSQMTTKAFFAKLKQRKHFEAVERRARAEDALHKCMDNFLKTNKTAKRLLAESEAAEKAVRESR